MNRRMFLQGAVAVAAAGADVSGFWQRSPDLIIHSLTPTGVGGQFTFALPAVTVGSFYTVQNLSDQTIRLVGQTTEAVTLPPKETVTMFRTTH